MAQGRSQVSRDAGTWEDMPCLHGRMCPGTLRGEKGPGGFPRVGVGCSWSRGFGACPAARLTFGVPARDAQGPLRGVVRAPRHWSPATRVCAAPRLARGEAWASTGMGAERASNCCFRTGTDQGNPTVESKHSIAMATQGSDAM